MSTKVSKQKQEELDQKAENVAEQQAAEQQQQPTQPTVEVVVKPEGLLQKGARILGTFLGNHKGKIAFAGGVVTGAAVTAAIVKNTPKEDNTVLIEEQGGTLTITDTTYVDSSVEE